MDPLLVVGVGGALEHDREEVLELAVFHVVEGFARGLRSRGPRARLLRGEEERALGRDAARSRRARRARGARRRGRRGRRGVPARARALTTGPRARRRARRGARGDNLLHLSERPKGDDGVLHAWFGRRRGGGGGPRRLAREERGGGHDARGGGEPRESVPAEALGARAEVRLEGAPWTPSPRRTEGTDEGLRAGLRRAETQQGARQRSSQEGGRVRVRARPSASARRRRHPRRVATARRRVRAVAEALCRSRSNV